MADAAGQAGLGRDAIPANTTEAGALRAVAGRHWTLLFRRVGGSDLGWMVVFWLFNMAVSVAIGSLVYYTVGAAANPLTATLGERSNASLAILFGASAIQLFGEEVFSILPFLALLWLLHSRLGMRRKAAIVWATVGCAIWFGAAHLPTYDWHFVQAFAVIGIARISLLLAYLKTKNILVSFGAHLLTDWGVLGWVILSNAQLTSSG